MTTETNDPLEQAVMEAADEYAVEGMYVADMPEAERVTRLKAKSERLRLHVQLFGAQARVGEHEVACQMRGANEQCKRYQRLTDDLAALEARVQEK